MFIPLDRRRRLSVQIYDHVAALIRRGELSPGERIPPSRELARTHGVARNTVLAAYRELIAEGYLETRGTGGTAVAERLPRTGFARDRREALRKPAERSVHSPRKHAESKSTERCLPR